MRKLILSLIVLISSFSLSYGFEANIKAGYDFFRGESRLSNYDVFRRFIQGERGFIIGVEMLPFTFKDKKIKIGAGIEHHFGEKSFSVKYALPLYATAKFTYYRPKNIDLNLYIFGRLGYDFSARSYSNKNMYYGLGFGLDYQYFLAEILYDGSTMIDELTRIKHKVGIRIGIQLGAYYFKKTQETSCTKCEPEIIEKIVEVPKVVEKKTTNKIIIKKFDVSAQALFEFNKSKLDDLKENGKNEIEKKVKELLKSGFEITGINVIGHTDRLGTDTYNYKLGLNRANAIAKYLKDLGIEVEIKSSPKGQKEPKVHCNNVKSTSKLKECLQPNRRVELQFIGFETEQKVEELVETGN